MKRLAKGNSQILSALVIRGQLKRDVTITTPRYILVVYKADNGCGNANANDENPCGIDSGRVDVRLLP